MRIVLADNSEYVGAHVPMDPRVTCDFLYSFWYAKKMEPAVRAFRLKGKLPAGKKVYLDSGVFSARKKNVVLPVQNLLAYYHSNADLVDHVFSMDEGTPAQQLENAKEMARCGAPVIPIYHGTMPLSMIADMAAIRPYIAVSFYAVGGPSGPDVNRFLDSIFNYVHKSGLWPLKIHALGTEKFSILSKYPFYSADSTGWATNYFLRKANAFDPIKQKLYQKSYGKQLEDAIKLDGLGSMENIQSTKAAVINRALQAAETRAIMQRMLTKVWLKKGISWPD